jgi:hypothetical protein
LILPQAMHANCRYWLFPLPTNIFQLAFACA